MTKGILAVWTDVDPAEEADFNEWYNHEHMIERVSVPGFHRARRYLTVAGGSKYFAYYVTDSAAVLASPAYIERLNDPSPWTQANVARFRNTNRSACKVLSRVGHGSGGAALTIRLSATPGQQDALARWLAEQQFPALIKMAGIVGAQLWQGDNESTMVETEERDLRPEPDQVADLAIFVEGADIAAINAVAEGPLSLEALRAHGAADGALVVTHQLLCSVEKQEPEAV